MNHAVMPARAASAWIIRSAGCVVALLLAGCAQASPVRVEAVQINTLDGVARGFVARVDLSRPEVRVISSRTMPRDARPTGAGNSTLVPTDQWAREHATTLAINANYFAKHTGGVADIIGLNIDKGVVVSPVRSFGPRPDPALAIFPGGVARAGYLDSEAISGAIVAVAGIGPSNTDSTPGTLLVEGGVNTGATARVEPLKRHPRTAVGVSRDGHTLIIAAIDGRQPDWSVGLTLPETADLLISHGAWSGVNLDGGGSTALVYQSSSGQLITNRPSDGAFRPVANHLGVLMAPDQRFSSVP